MKATVQPHPDTYVTSPVEASGATDVMAIVTVMREVDC